VFSVERPEEPCSVFPVINEEYAALRDAYNLGDDVDEDQLPEVAALALLAQASCSETNDLLDELITNAYMINLAGTESEQEVYDTGVWIPYQRALATLRILTSAMGEKLNKAFMEYGVQMHDFYVTVWCFSSGYCEPSNAQAASQPGVPVFGLDPGSSDKSLDATPRGFSELFSGAGDPDGDEVTNAQEWANVVARGGTVEEFALAALDPTDDGTLPVVVGGDGNCFIATAAYGTPLAAELSTLREFRDTRLLTNSLGRAFVDTYYRLSPPAADFIATHPAYRAAARNVIGLIIAAPIPLLLGAPALAAIRSFGSRRNKKSRSAVHLR
jgi:hypothetical protein